MDREHHSNSKGRSVPYLPASPKPTKRMLSKSFMGSVKGVYWLNSPTKEWAAKAKASFEKLSKRGTNVRTKV